MELVSGSIGSAEKCNHWFDKAAERFGHATMDFSCKKLPDEQSLTASSMYLEIKNFIGRFFTAENKKARNVHSCKLQLPSQVLDFFKVGKLPRKGRQKLKV
jgi:hypothetical protein